MKGKRNITSRQHGRRGNAIIEFALSFGFLFTLFAGVFELGYTLYLYNTLESAVRAGARYASYRNYDSTNATPTAAFNTAVKNMVVYGDPAGGPTPVAPGLTTARVQLTVTFNSGVPRAMTVAINGYPLDAIFRTYTLTNKPSANFPYAGVFSGGP